jgi:hypothetical protein
MSNITMDSESWIGSTLLGSDDVKVGRIEAIYFDEQTGRPQWMAVKTGLFGNNHHLVPLAEAMPTTDGDVKTPYDKRHVEDAPKIEGDEDLADDQVVELYRYYGLAYDVPTDDALPAREASGYDDRDTVVEPDDGLTAVTPGTQAELDMLVATGQIEPDRVIVERDGSFTAGGDGTPAEQDARVAGARRVSDHAA